jgi:DNA end-binding protein Ku
MARGLWKGAISFGLVNVPVELYSAEKQASELDLTMLDRRDLAPVGYQRVNKSSGKQVPWEEVVKGYEYEDGKYVVLTDEDFRRANVEASRTVEIAAFIELAAIQPQFFERPYYLAPVKRGEKAYALLRDALKRTGKAGIATVVIRTRQYLAALLAQEEVLLLNTLRYADELRDPVELGIPERLKGAKVSAKELEMALRLVEDMSEQWNPKQYHDTYREDILERVKQKVKAGQTEEITEPEKAAARVKSADVIDLMSLLKKSVAKSARHDKPKRAVRRRKAA